MLSGKIKKRSAFELKEHIVCCGINALEYTMLWSTREFLKLCQLLCVTVC
jgi:hypothetical protein